MTVLMHSCMFFPGRNACWAGSRMECFTRAVLRRVATIPLTSLPMIGLTVMGRRLLTLSTRLPVLGRPVIIPFFRSWGMFRPVKQSELMRLSSSVGSMGLALVVVVVEISVGVIGWMLWFTFIWKSRLCCFCARCLCCSASIRLASWSLALAISFLVRGLVSVHSVRHMILRSLVGSPSAEEFPSSETIAECISSVLTVSSMWLRAEFCWGGGAVWGDLLGSEGSPAHQLASVYVRTYVYLTKS